MSLSVSGIGQYKNWFAAAADWLISDDAAEAVGEAASVSPTAACGGDLPNTSDAEVDTDSEGETVEWCQNYVLIDNFQDGNLTVESLGGVWSPDPPSARIYSEADGLLVVGRSSDSSSLAVELSINPPVDIQSHDTLFILLNAGYALDPEPVFEGTFEILMEGNGTSGPISARTANPFYYEGEWYLVYNYDMRDPNLTVRQLSKIKLSIVPLDPTAHPGINLFMKVKQVWFCRTGWEPELPSE